MKEFGKYIAVNIRDEELGGTQLIIRVPTVLTVEQARQLRVDLGEALLHASPSFIHPGMTRQEALKEAIRRWGRVTLGGGAQVFDREEDGNSKSLEYSSVKVGRYWVGKGDFGPIFGNGRSWEEAFAAADIKEKELSLTD